MKSIAVCYSEHAIKVSDSYCSGLSSSQVDASSLKLAAASSSICNAVTCVYRVKVSNGNRILVGLNWDERMKPGFSIGFCGFPLSYTQGYKLIRKQRGTKAFESGGLRFEVMWDLSRAEYGSGPEPVARFYITVLINSETSLILGDTEHEVKNEILESRFCLISRSEGYSGNSSSYCTRARFCDAGAIHDIVVKCGKCDDDDYDEKQQQPVLWVLIDRKKVIQVNKLRWNFRGSQTIFIDGLVVDLMWDVHDLLFSSNSNNGGGRYAVFLFRTRNGCDSRLWLEEKDKNSDSMEQEKTEFSLLISACKNPK